MIGMANVRNLFRKILKFGLFIPVSNLMLLYGRRILPERFLDRIFLKRNKHIECIIDKVSKTQIVSVHSEKPEGKSPIWFFWMQGVDAMPKIPALCLKYLHKNANGHSIVVLDRHNIREYANIPDYIFSLLESGSMTRTHFSDILRLALLSEHGGFWVDATMLVVKPLPETIFSEPLFTIKNWPQGLYVSECRWTGFCLASWKGNVLTSNAYQMLIDYWKNTDVQVDYFIIDYIFDILYNKSEDVMEAIDKVPYSNERLHDLAPILCNKFDKDAFSELTADTYMFKLSWKKYTEEELLRDKDNYYNHLLKEVDGQDSFASV